MKPTCFYCNKEIPSLHQEGAFLIDFVNNKSPYVQNPPIQGWFAYCHNCQVGYSVKTDKINWVLNYFEIYIKDNLYVLANLKENKTYIGTFSGINHNVINIPFSFVLKDLKLIRNQVKRLMPFL
jgi:hypothetical protein